MDDKELFIQEPYNPTDFKVVFDPELEKITLAKEYVNDEEDQTQNYNSTKVDGYDIPIVLLNQQMLGEQFINHLEINYTGFTPTLELIVDDPRDEIQFIGGPGLRNFIGVILCPPIDGVYKSIAIPFYIKERINLQTDKIKYVCEYYNLGLTDIKSMQIGKDKLTTYEFCKEIAKLLQFGFACTDNCETVSDKRYRQSYSQRFKDFIQEQINISGSEDNILDAWIDTHRYLNLINLSWVFDNDVKAENLTTVVNPKPEVPSSNNADDKKPFEIQRTLLQFEQYPFSNLRIEKKYNKLNTNKTMDDGTDASFWVLKSPCDENILEMQDVQMEENSIEGKDTEVYKFRRSYFLGCEMDDEPYMIQEQIRKRWIEKKRAKQLIVELVKPNYGLERGTLINVGILEDDPAKIRSISQNFKNTIKETKNPKETPNIDNDAEPIDLANATDGNISLVNPALSGMYYIDGMKYVYDKQYGKIIHVLYLLKKSKDNNLFHAKASPNITEEQKDAFNSI